MLRRSTISLIAPLPLYKVGLVLIRQFSRPVVVQAVTVANEYPQLRSGLIYVGWYHYRISVHLHRLLWGAEQKAKQVAEENAAGSSTTATATAGKSENEPTTTSASSSETNSAASSTKTKILNTEAAEKIKQEVVQDASMNSPKGIASIGGVKTASTTSTTTPASTTTTASESKPEQKITIKKQLITTTSPRTLKLLPSFTAPHFPLNNPLRKVRNIFIAPPRPSDEELLEKGMKLCVEVSMFLCFCCVVLYEMWRSSKDRKAKRQLMEERFQRLENHIVHFPGCGCPEGAKDGEPPVDVELDRGLEKLVPDREQIRREKKDGVFVGGGGKKEEAGTVGEDLVGGSHDQDTTSSELAKALKPGQEGKTTTTTAPNDKQVKQNENVKSSVGAAGNGISTTSNTNQQQNQQKQQKRGGQIARVPTSVQDLINIWCSLPIDVQVVVVAVFAAPYCVMAAFILRLFMLVRRN